MKISVIIPTYNEVNVIQSCIESLGEQTYEDFEVITIDDGSTDKTPKILGGASKILPNFYFLEQNHKGAGAARNLGAKKAKGEILVFVDADMTFDENFLDKLSGPIRRGSSKGTFSKEEFVANWGSSWARLWNINEGWQEKRRHPKDFPDHQPVFRAILKSEFEKVGGFTPGGYDDDWSLSRKLGYEAISAPGAIFYHKNPESLGEIFRHAGWVGKRKYKLGYLGYAVALLRSSFPMSIIIGLYKGIKNKDLRFVIFKAVYDFGIFRGILEYMFSGRGAK